MKELVLYPTVLSQWYALVNEAQVATHCMLHEDTESYLVFLLMRFSQQPMFLESVVAIDYLQALGQPNQLQRNLLREVGDKSLLFCGLFPGLAERRHLNLNYFSQLGRTAYLTVGELHENQSDALFLQLSKQFNALRGILQSLRHENNEPNSYPWGIYNSP